MYQLLRKEHPRLFRAVDDSDYRFAAPKDGVRKRILNNMIDDCVLYEAQKPWKKIPLRPDSPYPYHQLYLTFYTGMQATALIENYAFVWRVTQDQRWLKRAKDWLLAASSWEHSDRVEEHFYTANRYMQAFALSLDLLDGVLTKKEKDQVISCLIQMMKRWWPDVEKDRFSTNGHHHAVVDNGHFGVAALYLLDKCPEAEQWLSAVIDRFRHGVMPHGCGADGEPGDGPGFWPWENLWMFQFADALRNGVGIDLYSEFPERVKRPLTWFRYHWAAPRKITDHLYYPANTNVLMGSQLDACSPTILRLAQDVGDAEFFQAALSDPRLGRLYRFGAGVKGSSAECMVSYGPYAYCFYDPAFVPARGKIVLPLSRTFMKAHYGEMGLLRSSWDNDAVIACVSGYKGGGAHGFCNVHVQWAGYPVLRTITAEEGKPVSCGSLPCVGNQNEVVAFLNGLETRPQCDRLSVRSIRTDHEYWLLHGPSPVLLLALRRKPRGVKVVREEDRVFARLKGRDFLQYDRLPHFNSRAGELRLSFRLNKPVDTRHPQVLFNTGFGVGKLMGTRVNTFTLGFLKDEALTFCVNSQRNTSVSVSVPKEKIRVGHWHEVVIRWGGFNRAGDRPFIELALDGTVSRCDDPVAFGELGVDSQRLQSRTTPRTFYIQSVTALAFGGAMQMPDTGLACDLALIDLKCPGRKRLRIDFSDGLGMETGSGRLGWKFNPVDLRGVDTSLVRFGAGKRVVVVQPAFGEAVHFEQEVVPFAPSGLAAGSLKSFIAGAQNDAVRVQAVTEKGDVMVLVFSEQRAKVTVERDDQGFYIRVGEVTHRFDVKKRGKTILERMNHTA